MTDAPSPFLPGTQLQYAWDSSSIGPLKQCPRKYYYSIVEGWRSKGEALHLTYGIWYHSALELYDKLKVEGVEHEEAIRQVVQAVMEWTWIRPEDGSPGRPWTADHSTKTRENLLRTVIWYLDQFGPNDPAKTLILKDGRPAVELSFKMTLDWGPSYDPYNKDWRPSSDQPYLLCGHLDRVVQFSDGYYVMDRKTTASTVGPYYFDQYDPDNQMTIYTIAARVIFETPVRGIIIDAAQIAVGFSRFQRGMTYRTPAQLEEWLHDLKILLRQNEGYAAEGYWPMNDKSCHQFGGCQFRKVCSKDPSVRNAFLESDFVRKPWNPLQER